MACSLAVASEGFERDMGGFGWIGCIDDAGSAQKISDDGSSASATDHRRFRDTPSTAS